MNGETLGPLIAIVGSDGSGKSTVGEALLAWLRESREVEMCHLGKQTGNIGRWLRRLPMIGGKVDTSLLKKGDRVAEDRGPDALSALVIYHLSMRRVRRFRRMMAIRRTGVTILADRYPQTAVPSPRMDGTHFNAANPRSRLARLLGRRERAAYDWMASYPPDLVAYVAIFAIVQLITLRSTPLGMLRLRDQYGRAAWADGVTAIVRFVGVLVAWAAMPTIAGFLIVWSLAELLTCAAFWSFSIRDGDVARMWAARIDWAVVARENPGFLRFAFSTNANVAIGLGERQLPLLLVGAFVGPAAAGAFRLAFQLAQALSKLAQMLTRAAFPELVHAVRRKPADKLNRLLVKILAASSAAAVAMLLVVVAIGGHLLALVGGAAYGPAYPILIWLAAAGCLDLATVGFEPVLMALHRAGTAFLVRLVSAIVMVVATVVLTPRFGAIGAAMALLVGSLVTESLLALVTFRAVAQMPPGAVLEMEGKRKAGAATPAD